MNRALSNLRACSAVMFATVACGCAVAPRNMSAVHAYYRYDFTTAREAVRGNAVERNDEQVLLNNARLGIAALADGDLHEAEIALGRSFELLSTAGLNHDRTTAAILVNEGVRIWKGEPFEQALIYHYVATLYAVMGDWENARAAAANSIFRLTDFGEHQSPQSLAKSAAMDPRYLEEGYRAVATDFALGYLMQAIASHHAGAPGMQELLDQAMQIDPGLSDIAATIRTGDYDTLLIIHWGKGPTKIAYGPDNALVKFQQQEPIRAPLSVSANGAHIASAPIVADVGRMSVDHRWNNLEDIRRAKSAIGNVLLYGGAIATSMGAEHRSAEAAFAGLGAMIAGALMKSGAQGDTRYLEFLPHAVYIVPLMLRDIGTIDLSVGVEGVHGSHMTLPNFESGTSSNPRTVYLRLLGPGSAMPSWLTASELQYGNDFAGVKSGDLPWIMGGTDVSTPTRESFAAYQSSGHLRHLTLQGLRDLYAAEEILIGQGMELRPGVPKNPSFRHILEGGTGLFTPHPWSMGYKRLMYTPRQPYRPKSAALRNRTATMSVDYQ